MLEWKIVTGDEKLEKEIERVKNSFDSWFDKYWKDVISKEKMLSEDSPVLHVYYKMCKSEDEIKKKFPLEAMEECSSCGKYVDKWIETRFSFCNEYGCGMTLCKDCAEKLRDEINAFLGGW